MPQIVVENLYKTFKVARRKSGLQNSIKSFIRREFEKIQAIKDVSFQLNEGELVGWICEWITITTFCYPF